MLRLFVATRPPLAVRDQLIDLMEGVPVARWQDDEQLHLTLRFIGEADERTAEDIAGSLSHLRFPPVRVALSGVGSFGRKGRTDSLWAGVAPRDALAALHRKVDQAVVRAGLAPEGRAFLPHITLARFGRSTKPDLSSFLARHAGLSSAPFLLDRFGLYRSHLSSAGAAYELLEEWTLC